MEGEGGIAGACESADVLAAWPDVGGVQEHQKGGISHLKPLFFIGGPCVRARLLFGREHLLRPRLSRGRQNGRCQVVLEQDFHHLTNAKARKMNTEKRRAGEQESEERTDAPTHKAKGALARLRAEAVLNLRLEVEVEVLAVREEPHHDAAVADQPNRASLPRVRPVGDFHHVANREAQRGVRHRLKAVLFGLEPKLADFAGGERDRGDEAARTRQPAAAFVVLAAAQIATNRNTYTYIKTD